MSQLYDVFIVDDAVGKGEFVEVFVVGVSSSLRETFRMSPYATPDGCFIVPVKNSWCVAQAHPDLYNLICVQMSAVQAPSRITTSDYLYNKNGVSIEHNRITQELSINIAPRAVDQPKPVMLDDDKLEVVTKSSAQQPTFSITISNTGEVTIGGMGAKALLTDTFITLFNTHVHAAPNAQPTVPISAPLVTTKFLKSL